MQKIDSILTKTSIAWPILQPANNAKLFFNVKPTGVNTTSSTTLEP